MGDRALRRQAALDQARRARGLNHPFLTPATAVLRTPGDQHPEPGGRDVEALAHILADPMQRAAAAAGGRFRLDHLLDPRQMRRQSAPVDARGRLLARRRARGVQFGLDRLHHRLDVLEQHLQLIGRQLLRAPPEEGAAHLPQDILETIGAGFLQARLAAELLSARGLSLNKGVEFGGATLLVSHFSVQLLRATILRDKHRLERLNVVGKGVGGEDHGPRYLP